MINPYFQGFHFINYAEEWDRIMNDPNFGEPGEYTFDVNAPPVEGLHDNSASK